MIWEDLRVCAPKNTCHSVFLDSGSSYDQVPHAPAAMTPTHDGLWHQTVNWGTPFPPYVAFLWVLYGSKRKVTNIGNEDEEQYFHISPCIKKGLLGQVWAHMIKRVKQWAENGFRNIWRLGTAGQCSPFTPLLAWVSITVKRHRDQENTYKGKHWIRAG